MSEEENTGGSETNDTPETANGNASPEPIIEQSKPQPGTMEVHHHPNVEKKNFKEYFLEFLMIFLAVTLGFFAENIREHYEESSRATTLISSLIVDLQKDTASINWLEDFRMNERKQRLDSFYQLLNNVPETVDKKKYYQLLQNVQEFYEFRQSDGTINQLKNAGYLRYFSDDELLKQISEYEFLIQDFKNDESMEFHLHYDKMVELIKQNSDNDDMYRFYVQGIVSEGTGIKPFKPDTLQSLKALLIEVTWYNNSQMQMQNERIKNKAIAFLEYLHKKYHL